MPVTGEAYWLAIIFIGLMGLAVLIYAVLDGYDLGVGILLPADDENQRDTMIASIGPFWDANETWLVLAVGILLIAFPSAHSEILYHLYLPVTLMLAGLILRGVAFDFRAKAPVDHKTLWDKTFKAGSLLASLAQGYMLGLYVMGFESSWAAYGFAVLSALCVSAAYAYIGGAWLVMKAEGELQMRAARWTRIAGWLTALGIAAVSFTNPLVSDFIFNKWFGSTLSLLMLIIPLMSLFAFLITDRYLAGFPYQNDFGCWIPFCGCLLLFTLSFIALGYSFFPYVVPGKMDIWQAAAAPESLKFILVGVVVVLPSILLYTAYAYRVFWGKATQLHYH